MRRVSRPRPGGRERHRELPRGTRLPRQPLPSDPVSASCFPCLPASAPSPPIVHEPSRRARHCFSASGTGPKPRPLPPGEGRGEGVRFLELSPRPGEVLGGESGAVKGRVEGEDVRRVEVEGVNAAVRADGSFEVRVAVSEETAALKLVAFGPAGSVGETVQPIAVHRCCFSGTVRSALTLTLSRRERESRGRRRPPRLPRASDPRVRPQGERAPRGLARTGLLARRSASPRGRPA